MAIVMRMEWPEVTPDAYEEARQLVGWERETPPGAIFHVAFFDDGGFKAIDVWESAESFQSFVDSRLMPGIAPLGMQTEPTVTITPATAVFNPGAAAG